VRRRHHPTTPARATVLSFDNDAQATERDLGSSTLGARVGLDLSAPPDPSPPLLDRPLTM
jgi:hypothetical protein